MPHWRSPFPATRKICLGIAGFEYGGAFLEKVEAFLAFDTRGGHNDRDSVDYQLLMIGLHAKLMLKYRHASVKECSGIDIAQL